MTSSICNYLKYTLVISVEILIDLFYFYLLFNCFFLSTSTTQSLTLTTTTTNLTTSTIQSLASSNENDRRLEIELLNNLFINSKENVEIVESTRNKNINTLIDTISNQQQILGDQDELFDSFLLVDKLTTTTTKINEKVEQEKEEETIFITFSTSFGLKFILAISILIRWYLLIQHFNNKAKIMSIKCNFNKQSLSLLSFQVDDVLYNKRRSLNKKVIISYWSSDWSYKILFLFDSTNSLSNLTTLNYKQTFFNQSFLLFNY